FNGNKLITTSGGGALVTSRADWAARALKWATQAREPAPHYLHREVGHNYRLSNVSAAVGCGQMEVVEERVARRRDIWAHYHTALRHLPLTLGPGELPEARGSRWLTCLLLHEDAPATPANLIDALAAQNVEARPLWYPMHRQPVFAAYAYEDRGCCDDLFRRGVCLPSGTAMSEADLGRITDVLRRRLSG
ncbi:MAG: DegT/DnrJ/EryC1/StrS family aminotransferase, partial [Catalinimonas sp.]